MRIFLCDDNESHRVLVRKVLEPRPDFEIVGEAEQASPVPRAGGASCSPTSSCSTSRCLGLNGLRSLPRTFPRGGARRADRHALDRLARGGRGSRPGPPRERVRAGSRATCSDLPSLVRGAVGQAARAGSKQMVRNWLAGDRDRAYARHAPRRRVTSPARARPAPRHRAAPPLTIEGLPDAEKAAKIRPLAAARAGRARRGARRGRGPPRRARRAHDAGLGHDGPQRQDRPASRRSAARTRR
jgi:hypothetical protein